MDNRDRLLDTALQLFAARGYDATGVQEICDTAGVTKPTLYHYFGSKVGLLDALLERRAGALIVVVRQAAAYHGDLTGSLDTLARALFDFASADPVFYRLQLALYFAPRESEAHQRMAGWNEQLNALVEGLFAAAERDHGNMRGRARVNAATFVGTLNTCIGLWLNGYAHLDDALRLRVLHQFEHGIYS